MDDRIPADDSERDSQEPESEEERILAARPRGEERHYQGEPLITEDDDIVVPAQQPVGRQAEAGGGEWPHPGTPPRPPRPDDEAPQPDDTHPGEPDAQETDPEETDPPEDV